MKALGWRVLASIATLQPTLAPDSRGEPLRALSSRDPKQKAAHATLAPILGEGVVRGDQRLLGGLFRFALVPQEGHAEASESGSVVASREGHRVAIGP